MPGPTRRRSTSEGDGDGDLLSSTLKLPDHAPPTRLPQFNPERCVSTPHINATGFIDDTYRDHRGTRLEPRVCTRSRGGSNVADKKFKEEFYSLQTEIFKWGDIASNSAQTVDVIERQHNAFNAEIEQRIKTILSARGDYNLINHYGSLKDRLNTIRRVARQLTKARSMPDNPYNLEEQATGLGDTTRSRTPLMIRSLNQGREFRDDPTIFSSPRKPAPVAARVDRSNLSMDTGRESGMACGSGFMRMQPDPASLITQVNPQQVGFHDATVIDGEVSQSLSEVLSGVPGLDQQYQPRSETQSRGSDPWMSAMKARQDSTEERLDSVVRLILEVQSAQTSFKKLQDDLDVLKSNTTEVWQRLKTDDQRLDRMETNLVRLEDTLDEKMEMVQEWIIELTTGTSGEVPKEVVNSILNVINDSAPGMVVEDLRSELDEMRGSMNLNRSTTEGLRNVVADLSDQLINMSQSALLISSPPRDRECMQSTRQERDIVRKGLERTEKQLKQIILSDITTIGTDISLIKKHKTVDVPAVHAAVGSMQKSLQKYVKFSGMDPEYCELMNELLDSAENWCLKIEELYTKAEIHSINTSKGDTSDVGIFSDNAKVTVYEFLESAEIAYLGWGNSVQKANRLYNHHLSEEIKSKLINMSDSYTEMKSWLIHNYGGVSRIVSDIVRDLIRKPKPSSSNSNALFSFYAFVSGALQRLERLSKVNGIDRMDLETCLFSRATLTSLSLVLPNQTYADWITEMTKAGLDYKNPVGEEAYKIFKNLCIIERNKSEGSRDLEKPTEPKPRSPRSPRVNKSKSVHKVVEDDRSKSDNESDSGVFATSYHNTKWYQAGLKFPCPLRNHQHEVNTCAEFFSFSPAERWSKMERGKICYTCIRPKDQCSTKKCTLDTKTPETLKCQGCAPWAQANKLAPLNILFCRKREHASLRASFPEMKKDLEKYLGKLGGTVVDSSIKFAANYTYQVFSMDPGANALGWVQEDFADKPAPTIDSETGKNMQVSPELIIPEILEHSCYLMQTVKIGGTEALVFFDRGANIHIIDGSLAEREGLQRVSSAPTSLTVVGGNKVRSNHGTFRFNLGPGDKGEYHEVVCIGMDDVTAGFGSYDLSEICQEYRDQAETGEKDVPLPPKVGGSRVHLLLGIKNTNLDPALIKILPSGIAVYLSPFKDIYGSRLIFAGPHRSFTKNDDGKRSDMSNAVFLIKNQIYEDLDEDYEDRCFSVTTDKRLGFTINPYPINEDDIWDCNGIVPEQFEESLDDHEKLLDLLSNPGNFCRVHCANADLEKFKHLVMDEEHIMDKLDQDEKLRGLTRGHCPLNSDDPNALNEVEIPAGLEEKTTARNLKTWSENLLDKELEKCSEACLSPNCSNAEPNQVCSNVSGEKTTGWNMNLICDNLEGKLSDITINQIDFKCDDPNALKDQSCDELGSREATDSNQFGIHKAHVPIAKFRNALDDEELEDKAGFRCAECAKCLTCKTSSKKTAISLREAREQQFIEESVRIDLEMRRVVVNYPFLKDPVEYLSRVHNNPNNYLQAVKVYKTQCKKSELVKDGMRKVHKDLVEKGFMIKLDDMDAMRKEMIETAPFQHYNPWRLVMKSDSVTTPVRMVVDPTMTRFNEILAKGENRIGLIFTIMIRCRCLEYIWSSDISKLYNQLFMDDPSLPYSLFLYGEELDPEKKPDIWVMVRAWYGIVSTGGQAGFALDKLTEMMAEKFPDAYKTLRENRYVDDILSGAETEMKRESQISAVEEVLKRGGFSLKFIVRSGEKPSEKASPDGECMKLLGYKWDSEKDDLSPGLGELNLNKKTRGERKPNLEPIKTINDAERLLSGIQLTRSLIVGKISEFYDPCGFFEPVKLQMKLLTGSLKGKDWNETLPEQDQIQWREILKGYVRLPEIIIPRFCLPRSGRLMSKIRLICLADAAEFAGGAAVYAGRETSPGTWSCSLLAAKSKIMKQTVPRNELSAILLCAELAFMIKSALGSDVEEIIYITDSTIALSWCSNQMIKLRLFVYNRVMTILRLFEWTTGSKVNPLMHIDGTLNLADLLTKKHEIGVETVSRGSEWIEGLDWMRRGKAEMPLTSYEKLTMEKSAEEIVKVECFPESFMEKFSADNKPPVDEDDLDTVDEVDDGSEEFFALAANAGRGVAELLVDPVFEGWRRALRITGYMQGWRTKYCHKKHLEPDKKCNICKLGEHLWDPRNENKKAEDYFFRWESDRVQRNLKPKELKKFVVHDGIIYDEGRLSPEFQFKTQDVDGIGYLDKHEIVGKIPVVLPDSPILYSFLMYLHTKTRVHASIENTVKDVFKKMRVVKGLRRLIKKIIQDCVKCRLMERKTLELRLSDHPEARTVLAPCFHSCMMDICYGFKGQPFKRSRTVIKIYGLVIVCLLSGATNIMALEGIETQDVCAALERHSCRYGVPGFIYVDNGTQLKALQHAKFSIRDLEAQVQDNLGIKIVVSNAKAHSERGRVERRIRVLRETMEKLGVNTTVPMTSLQWDTLFSKISNSIDNLPIARGDTSNETSLGYEIITPNRIKLGRNNFRSLEGNGIDLDMTSNFTQILDRNRSIYQQWYQSFMENVHLLNLRPNKWLKSSRLPNIDDLAIFLFNDSNHAKESVNWKLGRIVKVSGTKVSLRYSVRANGVEQTLVRSLRDISIVYSVGEFLINTRDHFDECSKLSCTREE